MDGEWRNSSQNILQEKSSRNKDQKKFFRNKAPEFKKKAQKNTTKNSPYKELSESAEKNFPEEKLRENF